MQAKLQTTLDTGNNPLPAEQVIEYDREYKVDLDFEEGQQPTTYDLAIERAITLMIFITSPVWLMLTLGKQVFAIGPKRPLIWDGLNPNSYPFEGDVTQATISDVGAGKGKVCVRVLEANKPIVLAVTTPVPTLPDKTETPTAPVFFVPTGQAVVELEPAAAA